VSKAFTSEEETPHVEGVVREPPRVAPGEVRWVTPEGHAALRAELERLRADAATLAGAAALETERAARGADLARRIALVEGTLAALTVRGADAAPDGVVAFATWVTVEDEDGRRTTWRLVGPDEADPRAGLVSAHSPVGRALLGREEGDEVEVERPGGRRSYTVVAVRRSAP
jgi:transcription elongation factor GreB